MHDAITDKLYTGILQLHRDIQVHVVVAHHGPVANRCGCATGHACGWMQWAINTVKRYKAVALKLQLGVYSN